MRTKLVDSECIRIHPLCRLSQGGSKPFTFELLHVAEKGLGGLVLVTLCKFD